MTWSAPRLRTSAAFAPLQDDDAYLEQWRRETTPCGDDLEAEHLKSSVRERVNRAAGVVRGVRAAIVSFLHTDHGPKSSATAAGRL